MSEIPRNPLPYRAPAGTPAATPPDESIVALPDNMYRLKWFGMAILLVAMGPWFAYDGWKGWPTENAKVEALQNEKAAAQKKGDTAKVDELAHNPLTNKTAHSDLALNIQKVLALALPVLGAVVFFRTARASRGAYRLSGDVVYVPGHPPVNLAELTEIDRSKWERKGIAVVRYKTNNGKGGTFRLDDFVYQREPTDRIFDRMEAALSGTGESSES